MITKDCERLTKAVGLDSEGTAASLHYFHCFHGDISDDMEWGEKIYWTGVRTTIRGHAGPTRNADVDSATSSCVLVSLGVSTSPMGEIYRTQAPSLSSLAANSRRMSNNTLGTVKQIMRACQRAECIIVVVSTKTESEREKQVAKQKYFGQIVNK